MKILKTLAVLALVLVFALPTGAHAAAADRAVVKFLDQWNFDNYTGYVSYATYNGTDPSEQPSIQFTFDADDTTADLKTKVEAAIVGYSTQVATGQVIWPGVIQPDWNASSGPAVILNKPTILSTSYRHNGSVQTSAKLLSFSGTTTGGTMAVHLTTDGTSGASAVCTGAPQHVNVIANDPSNTFGLGWALSNSNKTLTVTANVRSFSATTILGIPVLGSSSLAAAPNGTPVNVSVLCS